MINPILADIRRALGRRPGDVVAERPFILPSRIPNDSDTELDLLFAEVNKLGGVTRQVTENDIHAALHELVETHEIKKATLWPAEDLAPLKLETRLRALDVEIILPYAGKQLLAQCDLGITGVDFALPETGTLGLLSTAEKPRAVSLVPRVHLAILRPTALRADLHQVFAEAKHQPYLIFITGPSRTADIELTVTLGVHGPRSLYVWNID